MPGGLVHWGKRDLCLPRTLFVQLKWQQPMHYFSPCTLPFTLPSTFPDWALPWHGPCPARLLHCAERAKPISSLTWVEPEESSGAAKILPGQCGIPFKVVHKNRIQGFRHVNAIQDVRVCGGKNRKWAKKCAKEGRTLTTPVEEEDGNKGNHRKNVALSKALTLDRELDASFK